jgi:hypothetical protein
VQLNQRPDSTASGSQPFQDATQADGTDISADRRARSNHMNLHAHAGLELRGCEKALVMCPSINENQPLSTVLRGCSHRLFNVNHVN